MAKVTFRGHAFDDRTVEMILWAEKLAGFKFRISQGSYNTGGVAASAGTHDGGGAVDFSVRLLTEKKRVAMVKALKDSGFAAWYRTIDQGFDSNHVHAIAIGCKDLAPLAAAQVRDYDAHKNGLKGHAPDPTYRPDPKVKWDMKVGMPVSREPKPAAKKAPAKKATPAKLVDSQITDSVTAKPVKKTTKPAK
jgi:hypothetical protein